MMTAIQAVCDPNGRRWRVEGPGWTMKPEGALNAAEAEVICRTAAHALSLNAALVAGSGSDVGPSILPVAGTDGIGVLMRAANRVIDGMGELVDPIAPGDELRFTPARFQAPGRDLEDDGA